MKEKQPKELDENRYRETLQAYQRNKEEFEKAQRIRMTVFISLILLLVLRIAGCLLAFDVTSAPVFFALDIAAFVIYLML